MKEEHLSVFRGLYKAFRQQYDRAPNLAEWEDFVVEEKIFGPTKERVVRRLAARVFEYLALVEVASSEIEIKVRDAESNLNNRKHNFGNF